MITTLAIDKEIKAKASRRAKQEFLTISAVVRILLNDYAEGRIDIGGQPATTPTWKLSPELEKQLLKIMKDKDSPVFDTAQEAISYLRSK